MNSRWSRREFLRSTTAALVFGATEQALGAASTALQKRRLGKTGEMVSCIGFGSGPRFCSIPDEDAAQALLERAFDRGVNYFDTAGLHAAAAGAIERKTPRGVFEKAPQGNLPGNQDRSQRPRRRASLG